MADRQPYHSLARRFFVFTATLVLWVAVVLATYDISRQTFKPAKGLLLITIVVIVAASISRMTTRLLTRPLLLLQDGIRSVEEGRLEPIAVSQTGDEIQCLGESFNRMVTALATSNSDLLEHQRTLEDRIRQRTSQLEHAMQEAMAASAAKTEFLANMSHELRTPMNGLLGMLDMVLATPLASEQRDHLETAHSCAYALLALLNDLLDLSKIESGRMALERIPFNVREVFEDSARPHAAFAAKKGIHLRTEIAPSVPVAIEADPLRLRQIVANLLSNAVKFTDAGSIVMSVAAANQDSLGSIALIITVRDSGMGIPPEKQNAIFEKFTQGDSSITRRFGGTGLGLTITKHLVEMHGGTIAVESAVGRGSTFTVVLPCTETQRPLAISPGQGCNARILVVDDNAVNRKMVTGILERHGYSTAVASDGNHALQVLEQNGADVVLMDIQMPVVDGFEATRRIRNDQRWSRLPIVAMTAHAMNGDQESCLEAGMSAYLSKPVHASHLIDTVERLLKRGLQPARDLSSAAQS